MKTEKESLGFKLFWFFITIAPMYGLVFILLIPLNLERYLQFIISLFFSIFYGKMITDKQDLENKIFELKELIKDANTKT